MISGNDFPNFWDTQTGFVAGGSSGSGYVLMTKDGGASWETIHNSEQAAVGFSTVADANNIDMRLGCTWFGSPMGRRCMWGNWWWNRRSGLKDLQLFRCA